MSGCIDLGGWSSKRAKGNIMVHDHHHHSHTAASPGSRSVNPDAFLVRNEAVY